MNKTIETATGELFGPLWGRLTDAEYRQSVELFERRFRANGFDLTWLRSKRCLDAGTGSGRYAVAMALQGAESVIGCDVSVSGIATARERARDVPGVRFEVASVLDLPFETASFDFVCCAGVLHHTPSIARGLDELTRVLKPDGKLFLLLYGAGGLRWKQIQALRPLASELGQATIDAAIAAIGLPANNRKHFLDDLFVPIQDLVAWADLAVWLEKRGYRPVERWLEGRFDHEASPAAQLVDMEKLERIFAAVPKLPAPADPVAASALGQIGHAISTAFTGQARALISDATLAAADRERIIIGEGNHRVLATKG
jgi:ubiquinone/menaquinone biosynthesis C-methylase UbiE